MPISARKTAGIIRNILPQKVVTHRPRPVVVGSREELLNRRVQTSRWERTKWALMRSQRGRKHLRTYFPSVYAQAVYQQLKPGEIKSSRSRQVRVEKELGSLSPQIHEAIMSRSIPKIARPNFRIGQKKVYLPNIVVTLQRNKKLEPYHAVFEVPLNLSKLDMRDYLWHVYGVKIYGIQSSVLPGILRRPYKYKGQPRIYHGPMKRTKARKKMIVRLAEPFTYPPELNEEELQPYAHFSAMLMIGLGRRGPTRPGESRLCNIELGIMASYQIHILCTIYITNGARSLCSLCN
jgi:Ribosomal protein L23